MAASEQHPQHHTTTLERRQLKPDIPFRAASATPISQSLKQNTLEAASSAKETLYRIPLLSQNGVEFLDVVDPCSLLASNDDPQEEETSGIEGLDWSQIDPALLANCTSMPSSAPSYFGGVGRDSVVCSEGGDGDGTTTRRVVVKYLYKVESVGVDSAMEFLPQLESKILNELQSLCGVGSSGSGGGSGGYSFVSIESAPNDKEINAVSCDVESSADDCFIIDGAVTLIIDSSSNTLAAKDAARETIANAMNNDSLLDSTTLPEVIDVQYLDESYEDYLVNQGGGDSITCPGAPANAASTKEVVVTYAYEVETAKADSSAVFLPKLEGEILKQLVGQCELEGYNLVGIKSTPDDVEVAHAGRCTVDESRADDCYIFDGALTLEIDSSSNSTLAEESVRENIISAMDNNDLLNPTDMPEVIDVQYLDKTYNDFLKNSTVKSIMCDASELFIISSNATVDTSKVLVMYIYEVETVNVSSTSTFLPALEENILMELGEKCEKLQMYGVMGIHSIPDDIEMKTGPCSIESSISVNCFIIEGGLTLDIVSSFNSTWATDQTHSILKTSMDNDDLLNATILPEVIKVRYLDNETFADYMGGYTSQDGGIVVVGNKRDMNMGAIIGSLVGIICLIILAMLLLQRQRKRRQLREAQEEAARRKQAIMAKEMELDLEDDLDDLVADIESSTAKRSAAGADPDGHFHLGNHHYTADGVRYWSPNCALCVAAKASGALDQPENELSDGEVEHDFDELSYDLNATKKFSDFNIHDLGKHHSSMHVRECKSKTCQGCKDNLNGVVFIHSKKPSPSPSSAKPQNKSIML